MNNNRPYQICSRCVMDTSDEDIVFDENGFCNHCTGALTNQTTDTYQKGESEKAWEGIVANMKGKGGGKKYDCIMGVSGGVDSCYAVYLAVKSGLRPLLMHMDNGWDSDISVKNIKNLVERLGLDYISYVLDWREFREIQLAFLKASSVDLEIPTDIGILASIFETADKYGIKYIVSGGNASSESILPLTWGYHVKRDLKLYKSIVKRYASVKLKKIPHVGILKEIYFRFVKNIRTIYILNYFEYDKDKAREFLKENYGWQDYGGKHHESKITAFWQGYVMPTKFNMDYRRVTCSSQIVAGQITREEALKMLESLPYDESVVGEQKAYVAKKYSISQEQLEEYLARPPKTYKDFPNNKKLIDFLIRQYKRMYKNKRL